MRKLTRLILALALPAVMAGCTSTKAYFVDRGRDACDMVTVAAEAPSIVNATVQLGPLMTGLGLASGNGLGLRSGAIGVYETDELNLVYGGLKVFTPGEVAQQRGKGYDFWYGGQVKGSSYGQTPKGEWFNWLQFEVALNVVVGVRVGVNLGEIVDFVLGWTTLDICGDDIGIQKLEEKSNQVPEDTARKLVDPQH